MTLQPFALLTIWTRTSNTQLKMHTELTASMHCNEYNVGLMLFSKTILFKQAFKQNISVYS